MIKTTYTEDIVNALIQRLVHAQALQLHLLVEYAATADFWVDEVIHCLSVIDGYPSRVECMREASRSFVSAAKFDPDRLRELGGRFKSHKPGLTTGRRKDLRRTLLDATHALFERMLNEHLIDSDIAKRCSLELGIEFSGLELT